MRRAIALAAIGLVLLPGTTGAQQTSIAEQRAELDRANRASANARARARRLQREAADATDAARRARREQAAVAARAEAAEADIAAARARIRLVDEALTRQRRRLEVRRAPTVRLVAALQSMARRPASLALLQPGSARDAVHVRALLASIAPVVQARSASVRAEMERTRQLRNGARLAAASLRDGRARLEQERLRLIQLESESRLRSRTLARGALVESDRALALGEEAREIVDRIQAASAAETVRARLMTMDGPLLRPGATGDAADGAPPYRLPVVGRVVTGLGEVSENGIRARGLTLAVQPGVPVVAPADGRVLFARPFGVYSTVVILDHGEGWTSLLSGLGEVTVGRGDVVEQGAPVGRAVTGADPRVMVELRRRGVPFDLVAMLR